MAGHRPPSFPGAPPEASRRLRKAAQKLAGPVESFLALETAGGILLLVAAATALLWANSPWKHSYHDLWHTPVGFGVGDWSMVQSLHFWINDGLMTIFFLLAGLEIKREMAHGELSDLKRASLPILAAIGGMVVPALIYFALNPSGPAASGWGVPMATDIAFALGVLSLLGRRVPAAMRILLLALAIIDDLGAILVIAIFYSSNIDLVGLAVAGGGMAVLLVWLRVGVRPGIGYSVPLVILWAGLYKAGVHPTLAGVIVGLATPVKPWLSIEQFAGIADKALTQFRDRTAKTFDHHDIVAPLRQLALAGRETISPVVRLESNLHTWVAFAIMPLFAIANAGVDLGAIDTSGAGAFNLMAGVAIGLALGKPLGVMFFAWLGVKLGWCNLPRGMNWMSILIIGIVAGIGFTMSIFIAELAFKGSPGLLGLAKLAILGATAAAGIAGMVLGRLFLSEPDAQVAAMTASQAERSTDF